MPAKYKKTQTQAVESSDDQTDTSEQFDDDVNAASEDDNEINEDDELQASNNHITNIDVSDTSSSEGNSDDEAENSDEDEHNTADTKQIRENTIRNNIENRYEQTKGKKLYIRFPKKLPADDEALEKQCKDLSNLITQVHRPRQKFARFCLVDFANQTDRDGALLEIRKLAKSNESFKGLVVAIPRTESDGFVNKLVESKLLNLANKKAKLRLKRAGIKAKRQQFTCTLIVTNLPKRSSILELRTAFPTAVDVQIKRGKAAITLPSTAEARTAFKNPPKMSGLLLKVRFDDKRAPKGGKTLVKDEKIESTNEITENDEQKIVVKSAKKRKLAVVDDKTAGKLVNA